VLRGGGHGDPSPRHSNGLVISSEMTGFDDEVKIY
jgi:hypothetical protein